MTDAFRVKHRKENKKRLVVHVDQSVDVKLRTLCEENEITMQALLSQMINHCIDAMNNK